MMSIMLYKNNDTIFRNFPAILFGGYYYGKSTYFPASKAWNLCCYVIQKILV